ncbi:MAG: phosphoribosyltransferase domain-containing protein [Candidatus Magasanikbacteria bacterium]
MTKPLIYIKERIGNNKRSFVIINPFTGRGIPINHKLVQKKCKELVSKLKLDDIDYILGFCEQGIVPAYTIAFLTKIPFISSTRTRLNDHTEIHFVEEHSMFPNQYIYGLKKGDKVAIIEDEITTGKTLCNAITSLHQKGVEVKEVGALIMTSDTNNLGKLKKQAINPKYIFTKEDIIF